MLDMNDRPMPRPSIDPAIVGIMARVWCWLAWLVASFGAFSVLYNTQTRTAGGFNLQTSGLYFLAHLVVVGYMATKPDWTVPVLVTASLVMLTVTVMVL